MKTKHVTSTPSGRRVLTDIGRGYAAIGDAYDPDCPTAATERLRFRATTTDIAAEPDGIWLGSRHLWTIAVSMAKRFKRPMTADEIGDALFYGAARPDVHAALAALMTTFNPDERWWREMAKHAHYDPQTATIHPVH